jgi:hypothetical protein
MLVLFFLFLTFIPTPAATAMIVPATMLLPATMPAPIVTMPAFSVAVPIVIVRERPARYRKHADAHNR